MQAGEGEGTVEGGDQLRNLADNLPNGMVFQLLSEGDRRQFLYVSKGVEHLFGVSADAALADASALYGRIDPKYIPGMMASEAAALTASSPFFVEVELSATPGQETRWVQISSAPRRRPDGVEVWDGFVLDITARKLAELALVRSEHDLELATDAAAIGIWHWDIPTGRFVYSPRARALYGFDSGTEITFEILRHHNLQDDDAAVMAALQRALDPAVRSREVYRYRIRRADSGEVRWLLAHGQAVFEDRGNGPEAVAYVGTLQDVTEATVADEALRQSEARLRLAIAAGRMAVWELDVATGSVTPSPELNALYGFAPDARPSLDDFRSRYAPGERERVEREATEALSRGETQFEVEIRHLWPDGTERWLAVRTQVLMSGGAPTRLFGVVADVTTQRLAERRLMVVARELQHRVKNSLTVVQMLASQTFRPNRPFEEANVAFTDRLRALSAATDLVTRADLSDVDLRDVAEEIVKPYRDPERDAFRLRGPPVKLNNKLGLNLGMALHELATNAVKYGALSVPAGRVAIEWSVAEGWLELIWTELDGPAVSAPSKRGFGTRLLERGLFGPNTGAVTMEFLAEGLVCRIAASLASEPPP